MIDIRVILIISASSILQKGDEYSRKPARKSMTIVGLV